MSGTKSPLDHVTVAAPCSVGWENMAGDERVRFCGQCSLNVYNLSGMTKREAERLVVQSEGRLCARFYRRADGTMLTKDCPVGLRALRKRAARVATAIASAALSFFTGILAATGLRERPLVPAIKTEERLTEPVTIHGPGGLGVSSVKGEMAYPTMGQAVVGRMPLRKTKPGRFKRH